MAFPVILRDPILNQAEFEAFGCNVVSQNPSTPDPVVPDVSFVRDMDVSFDLMLADGSHVTMWVFTDPVVGAAFPSPPIRVREGQIVHTTLHASKGSHTIHHHAIEPTPFNDGVGHTSFEVTGSYTYQWFASQAGTYFYHCHKNTVLHFEMGMYGLLIVDPPQGPGFVRRANAVIPYDVEAFWVADEIDPFWHSFNHNAGLQCPNGQDSGLNYFNPTAFLISGAPSAGTTITDPRVAINARVGQTILLRVGSAGYTVQRYTINGLDAEVIEIDGRPLGQSPHSPYSRPFTIPAGTSFELTSAQRWTLLIKPTVAGNFPATIQFSDWIKGNIRGSSPYHTARTVINVSP
jgi:FtsP/CotA-like multicopper oxidase with cupredoxin domain